VYSKAELKSMMMFAALPTITVGRRKDRNLGYTISLWITINCHPNEYMPEYIVRSLRQYGIHSTISTKKKDKVLINGFTSIRKVLNMFYSNNFSRMYKYGFRLEMMMRILPIVEAKRHLTQSGFDEVLRIVDGEFDVID
jgi:hypothetical protein